MVWNEGYVSEINYTCGFYGELSPLKLAFASAIKLVQAPDTARDFTYCELACGRGYSSNLLAATYPQAQFYANDFNPSHIIEARALAESASLGNIHFFDDSFEEFLERDLPLFDFIALHGIYSWISPKNREAIIQFIRRNLKVGGLVYLSYNALPGWAAAMPMQALMLRHGGRSAEPILSRIEQALSFTGQLIEANAGYFVQNPIVKTRYEKLKDQNRNYLAHEYFNQEWNSFYFDEVAGELEAAKLNYIGSAHVLDNIDAINLTQAAQQQLAQISDPIYREVVRDFFLSTQFRRDIFGRGKLTFSPREQVATIGQTRFALIAARSSIELERQFPVGKVELQERVYHPICNALAEAPLTVEQLQQHPETQHLSFTNLCQSLIILTGIGCAHPAVDDETYQQRKPSTDAFNAAVQARAIQGDELVFLASPLIGSGAVASRLEQLFLLAKSRNQDGPEFVWQILSSQGNKLVREGKTLETPEENLAYLQDSYEEFCRERLLTLQKLGID